MDFRLIWTPRALSLLEEIVRRVAGDDPPTAERIGLKLVERTALLAWFPELGHVFSELGRRDVRELACAPYRIIYRVDSGRRTVFILAVWHGARQEPGFDAGELNEPSAHHGGGLALKAIAAMSLDRVIGRGNRIPWHLPEDFRWFKQTTMGGTLIMGRRTFESIGKPLPGRTTVVLSRTGFAHPQVKTAGSLADLPSLALPEPRFVCGGAEIYRQTLPLCSDLYLTLVKLEIPDGDAFLPPFETDFALVETIRETPEFDILHFRNRGPAGS